VINSLLRNACALAIACGVAIGVIAAQSAPQADDTQPAPTPAAPATQDIDPVELLLKQIQLMREEMTDMRIRLAQADLALSQAERERDELQQFIDDHQQYGEDFAKYHAVKEQAEREAKRKAMEESRKQYEIERAQREARWRAIRAQKLQRDAFEALVQRYRNAGFSPVGLDVYSGKMAFYYGTKDLSGNQVEYNVDIGTYLSPIGPLAELDYSRMTISGSIINGADAVRDIGVAITFFDDNGNQVGHETVQIKNARPDVPYPFTSKIDMALNRAFDSSSIYVLYADPVQLD
jgi:hypothetical protein